MKHSIWHLIACLLPLLIIFLLPLLGFGRGMALFVVIIVMFACHLLMMRGNGHGQRREEDDSQRGGHTHAHH